LTHEIVTFFTSTGVELAVTVRVSKSERLTLEENLPDQSPSLRDEVRTVQHLRPASTMSLKERIAELREIREKHAGDPADNRCLRHGDQGAG
jgi:hypothetical protein